MKEGKNRVAKNYSTKRKKNTKSVLLFYLIFKMKNKIISKAFIQWGLNKCVPNVLSLQERNEQIGPLFDEIKETCPYWEKRMLWY